MSDPRDPVRPGGLTCDEVRDMAASFVLDALEPAEMAAVREHLATCADPHAEMGELAGVLPVLEATVPLVEPPASLKARIMAAAAADLEARRAASATIAEAEVSAPAGVVTPLRRQPTRLRTWALGIAAALAIVALGAWNYNLQQQLTDARAYEQQVAAVLDAAQRPGSLTALMRSDEENGPNGLAAVTTDGVALIALRDLAPISGSEVYEAWVIGSDGVPVPLGELAVKPGGVGYLQVGGLPTEPGIVLALTREPKPGATAPCCKPISVGKAATT
jgi:hypothetical protein